MAVQVEKAARLFVGMKLGRMVMAFGNLFRTHLVIDG